MEQSHPGDLAVWGQRCLWRQLLEPSKRASEVPRRRAIQPYPIGAVWRFDPPGVESHLWSAPTTGGFLTGYLLFSEDNTTPLWPGGISPTSSADQSALLAAWLAYDTWSWRRNLALLQLTLSAGVTTYYPRWHSPRALIGQIGTYATVLVYNQSGVALAAYSAGNQSTTYVTESYN